jgi:hypothetical protein
MAKRFYAVLLADGKRRVIECSMGEIEERLRRINASMQGEGDSGQKALARAEKSNPKPGCYSGFDPLPIPK